MSRRREVLPTVEQWEKVKRFFRGSNIPRMDDREPMIDAALKAFYQFSKVALDGKIYQTDFPHPVRAGEG